MPMQDAKIDESIRQLTLLDWPTRKIARKLGIAQSTVVRRRQKMNTGPNPVLPAGSQPSARRRIPAVRPAAAVAVALLVLAVIAANILWIRFLRSPAIPAQATVCVRYSATGNVTGITAGSSCPSGWKAIVLIPGR